MEKIPSANKGSGWPRIDPHAGATRLSNANRSTTETRSAQRLFLSVSLWFNLPSAGVFVWENEEEMSRVERTVNLRCCIVLGLAFAALPSFSAAQSKAAWEWTVDERLAARFDPAKIRERDEAYVAMYGAAHPELRSEQNTPPHTELRYRIDGARNPELFLPHELFDYLLRGVASEERVRSRVRQEWAAGLRGAGFDPDLFWPALESLSAAYVPWIGRQGGISTQDRYERCHARYVALEAARQRFGARQFDRMLYTVVAPPRQFGVGTNFPNPGEDLRREAAGCQDSSALR